MNKSLCLLLLLSLGFSCLHAQERTTYRGDTTLYPSIRKRIALVSDSIRSRPGNQQLYINRAFLLYDTEQWSAAEADLSTAIKMDSTQYLYYYKRGATRDRLNNIGGAYEDFSKTIALNPSYEWGYVDLGMIMAKAGMSKEAEAQFRKALTVKPNWANALFNIGGVYEDLGAIDSALHYYKLALSADSNDYKAHNNIGSIYNKQRKFIEAIQHFDKALKIWGGYTFALTNRAQAKFSLGDKPGACADIQRAIQLGRKDKVEIYNRYCR